MPAPLALAALSPQAIAAIGTAGLAAALSLGLITQQQFSKIKGNVGTQDIIRPGTDAWTKAFGASRPDITTPEGYKFKWQGGEYKQLRQPGQPSFPNYNGYLDLKQTEKDAYNIATGGASGDAFSEGYANIFNKKKVDAPRGAGVPAQPGEGYKDNELPALDPNAGAYRDSQGKFTAKPPITEAGAKLRGSSVGAGEATHDVDTIGDVFTGSGSAYTLHPAI